MQSKGFIFSLDAFVAFSLIMITISMLIFTIGTPKPYYDSLEQAQQLAHDTLQVLATSTDSASSGTYLEQLLGNSVDRGSIMRKVAGGDSAYNGIIPKSYGFELEKYEFSSGSWLPIYNSAIDPSSDRKGKTFTKIQASATTFASLYEGDDTPRPGESPFCYLSCRGYNGIDNNGNPVYDVPCNTTPCTGPGLSNFLQGSNTVTIARLTVYG